MTFIMFPYFHKNKCIVGLCKFPFRLAPTLSLMILFRFSHNQMTSYKFKLKLNNNIKHGLIFNHNARHHTETWLFIREFCHGALTSSLHSCASKAAIKHEHYIH